MKKNILFVDDEPLFLKGVERMLHKYSSAWDVSSALGVDAALLKIGKVAFDAIISDVSMPGKDGFELLKHLRTSDRTKDIPVIILTGESENSLKSRALDLGATDLLNKPVNQEDLVARLHSALRLKSFHDKLKTHNNLLERKVKERTTELEMSHSDIILRLGKVAEYRDEETGNHIIRVGCYCHVLAKELGMTQGFTEKIFLASLLHDIGKIGIPDDILLKRGKLTTHERMVMQQHCAIGADILSPELNRIKLGFACDKSQVSIEQSKEDNPLLEMASIIALTHHEKWDGTGYPKGLIGQDIPIASRIVALADVYDALRSERPYKESFSEEKTLDILESENGKHFDPMVFQAFGKSIKEFVSIQDQYADQIKDREKGVLI